MPVSSSGRLFGDECYLPSRTRFPEASAASCILSRRTLHGDARLPHTSAEQRGPNPAAVLGPPAADAAAPGALARQGGYEGGGTARSRPLSHERGLSARAARAAHGNTFALTGECFRCIVDISLAFDQHTDERLFFFSLFSLPSPPFLPSFSSFPGHTPFILTFLR